MTKIMTEPRITFQCSIQMDNGRTFRQKFTMAKEDHEGCILKISDLFNGKVWDQEFEDRWPSDTGFVSFWELAHAIGWEPVNVDPLFDVFFAKKNISTVEIEFNPGQGLEKENDGQENS